MHADVVRLDLSLRRRVVWGYAVGMALYTFVIVALYPTFEHSTSLDSIVKNSPTVAALLGVIGSLTSPVGWLNANLYANFLPLIVLLATIGYGAACVAGQDEEGTLALVATLPIRRRRIASEKVATMALQAFLIVAVVSAVVAIGRAFDVTVDPGALLGAGVGVLLLGIDFGLVALSLGATTGSRGLAIGVATALASASYLISSLAPVVGWMHPARFVSLFFWSVGNDQLRAGLSPADALVLVGVGAVLSALSALAFSRLDLH